MEIGDQTLMEEEDQVRYSGKWKLVNCFVRIRARRPLTTSVFTILSKSVLTKLQKSLVSTCMVVMFPVELSMRATIAGTRPSDKAVMAHTTDMGGSKPVLINTPPGANYWKES